MSLRENIFDRQRVLSGILRSERFPNDIYPRLQLMIKDVNSLINHADFSFQRLDYTRMPHWVLSTSSRTRSSRSSPWRR